MLTALVTGASRSVGRGVAFGFVEAGFTVYSTGHGIDSAYLPPSVVRIRCDHSSDEDTGLVFQRLGGELDVLAWGVYEHMVVDGQFTWPLVFWQQPSHRWLGK